MEKYKFLWHDNGLKFQAFGPSLEKAFENSAYVLTEIICKEKVKDALITKIKVSGDSYERLLYNFLQELLFLLSSERFILNKINRISNIQKDNNGDYQLVADLSGDEAAKYELNLNVKAARYEEIFVKSPGSRLHEKFKALKTESFSSQEKKRWICQVVVEV